MCMCVHGEWTLVDETVCTLLGNACTILTILRRQIHLLHSLAQEGGHTHMLYTTELLYLFDQMPRLLFIASRNFVYIIKATVNCLKK